jgi:AbrB family looped-hinge helix DNA binding protein
MSELPERVKVGVGGQITIPKSIRGKLGIRENSTILELKVVKNKVIMEVLAK